MSKGGWSEFNDPLKTIGNNTQNSVTPKGKRQVRLERTRSGKKGKLVTVIKGLELKPAEAKEILELLIFDLLVTLKNRLSKLPLFRRLFLNS